MRTGFPFLSRFVSKIVEIVGAGLASAAGAFLLGHIAAPAAPAPVVQIVPADAETIRMVRSDPMLADQVHEDLSDRNTLTAAPATASVKVEKSAKGKARPPQHERSKAEVVRDATDGDAGVPGLPMHIIRESQGEGQRALLAPVPAGKIASPSSSPDTTEANENHFQWLAALRQIPEWLVSRIHRPAAVDAPRPPLPVGRFWQSTM